MSIFQAMVLGAIQGLTEFLPISSSAHLYIVPTLLHWPYAGLAFDVALHWGTLLALLAAFWRDWLGMLTPLFSGASPARRDALSMWLKIALASVPGALAGVALKDVAESQLRNLPLQAAMLALFGFLLWAVDRFRPAGTRTDQPGWGTSLGVGLAQALALIPGVSRSGVTITAGRASGLDRVSAARFSFLLATPITFGAGLLELHHLSHDVSVSVLAAGVLTSAVVGLITIQGLMRWLGRAGFAAFFIYRVALALLIVWSLARH
jgi:undecaprenyl-diphosphatase